MLGQSCTNDLCLLGSHIGPELAVVWILAKLLCLSRLASQLASDPAKGGGRGQQVVNKEARCLNTMSILDGSEERNSQIRRFGSKLLILFSLNRLPNFTNFV